jgi:F-type H+-transporting ATPase subunit a
MEIGQQLFFPINIFGIQGHFHGQVLLRCGLVLSVLFLFLQTVKNTRVSEIFFQFIRGISKNQHAGNEWIPFLGTLFLFIFISNWMGALIPWQLVPLPNSSIAAPTNDVNTTVALSLLVSFVYFYAGLKKNGVGYFRRYIEPFPFLFPLKVLEDFTKPLSLRFRLFGNILADELVVAVLVSLVPFFIPIPLILLGLFTRAIQALIFTTLAAAYIGEAKE